MSEVIVPKVVAAPEVATATYLDGLLFDLDGVLVPTARIHMAAWQELFDSVFASNHWAPPYGDSDYFAYVDGRSRYDGVHDVLASRGVDMDWGQTLDPPEAETICGLANRKNQVFLERLATADLKPFPETTGVLASLAAKRKKMAVVSSSRNAEDVLRRTGLRRFFDHVVDGRLADERTLPGKPAPDTFLYAAAKLGLAPKRCVVIEDALAGVAAGWAGGFGLVVGVDRGAGAQALVAAGADAVVTSLAQLMRVLEREQA